MQQRKLHRTVSNPKVFNYRNNKGLIVIGVIFTTLLVVLKAPVWYISIELILYLMLVLYLFNTRYMIEEKCIYKISFGNKKKIVDMNEVIRIEQSDVMWSDFRIRSDAEKRDQIKHKVRLMNEQVVKLPSAYFENSSHLSVGEYLIQVVGVRVSGN